MNLLTLYANFSFLNKFLKRIQKNSREFIAFSAIFLNLCELVVGKGPVDDRRLSAELLSIPERVRRDTTSMLVHCLNMNFFLGYTAQTFSECERNV